MYLFKNSDCTCSPHREACWLWVKKIINFPGNHLYIHIPRKHTLKCGWNVVQVNRIRIWSYLVNNDYDSLKNAREIMTLNHTSDVFAQPRARVTGNRPILLGRCRHDIQPTKDVYVLDADWSGRQAHPYRSARCHHIRQAQCVERSPMSILTRTRHKHADIAKLDWPSSGPHLFALWVAIPKQCSVLRIPLTSKAVHPRQRFVFVRDVYTVETLVTVHYRPGGRSLTFYTLLPT